MKKSVWGGVGVVVVLAVGVVVLAGGRLPWLAGHGCRIVSTVAAGPVASATAAPGGGGLQVVEEGSSRSGGSLSVGAIVQNNSTAIAYHSMISFGDWRQEEIPVLLPGQRIGVGAEGQESDATVTPRTTTWLSADALGVDFQPATATYLRTIRPPQNQVTQDQATLDIHYTEHGASCRDLIGSSVGVVLRDAGGKIVGGATEVAGLMVRHTDAAGRTTAGSELQPPKAAPCSQGDHESWAVLGPPRPGVTNAPRAELYPYCGV